MDFAAQVLSVSEHATLSGAPGPGFWGIADADDVGETRGEMLVGL